MISDTLNPGEVKKCVKKLKKLWMRHGRLSKKTNFVNGCLFSNDSCMHLTPEQFTLLSEAHHSLSEWDPEKKRCIRDDKREYR